MLPTPSIQINFTQNKAQKSKMLEIVIAVISLELCLLGLMLQLMEFARKDAKTAATDRSEINTSIRLMHWRVNRIESHLGLEPIQDEQL